MQVLHLWQITCGGINGRGDKWNNQLEFKRLKVNTIKTQVMSSGKNRSQGEEKLQHILSEK